jgi:hypothetical protein
VASDRAALQVLDKIKAGMEQMAQAVERLERELTLDEYAAARQALNDMYRALGDAQAVAASAGARRGGYKGAAATNASRALSAVRREKIKDDFDKAFRGGMAKEVIYQRLASRYRLSDRTIRRVVTGHR